MSARKLILVGLAASLSACVSLLPSPESASTVYRLSSDFASVDQSASAELVRVDKPSASQVFSSNDIVVSKKGRKLSVIADANWSESMPSLIQSSLLDALGGSTKFIALTASSGASTETRVNLDVQNFEANFDEGSSSAPLAIVSYRVTYTHAKERKLLGTYTVRRTQRADSINVSSIVGAMESANQAAMLDIVQWMETKQSLGGS